MVNTLNLLINLLEYINNDDTIPVLNNRYDTSHPIVIATLYLANEILIGDDGHPDREKYGQGC